MPLEVSDITRFYPEAKRTASEHLPKDLLWVDLTTFLWSLHAIFADLVIEGSGVGV
jgi:hypothetical protein